MTSWEAETVEICFFLSLSSFLFFFFFILGAVNDLENEFKFSASTVLKAVSVTVIAVTQTVLGVNRQLPISLVTLLKQLTLGYTFPSSSWLYSRSYFEVIIIV